MAAVAEHGQQHLVELLASKGANNWKSAMKGAAKGGHISLVKYFISKGADNWDDCLIAAAQGGHKSAVEYFIKKGATTFYSAASTAAAEGHIQLVEYFITHGFYDWNSALQEFARRPNMQLVGMHVATIGANNRNRTLASATCGGHEAIEYAIHRGATNWRIGRDGRVLVQAVDKTMWYLTNVIWNSGKRK